jgi:hypothetical protein
LFFFVTPCLRGELVSGGKSQLRDQILVGWLVVQVGEGGIEFQVHHFFGGRIATGLAALSAGLFFLANPQAAVTTRQVLAFPRPGILNVNFVDM